jgi:hypothetical protein
VLVGAFDVRTYLSKCDRSWGACWTHTQLKAYSHCLLHALNTCAGNKSIYSKYIVLCSHCVLLLRPYHTHRQFAGIMKTLIPLVSTVCLPEDYTPHRTLVLRIGKYYVRLMSCHPQPMTASFTNNCCFFLLPVWHGENKSCIVLMDV